MTDDNRTEQAALQDGAAQDGVEPRVVTPEGEDVPAEAQEAPEEVSRIEEPAKVMRIGGMIKRLLDEVRDAPLDEAARTRLAEIHERSIHELEDGLSPDLIDELHRITLPFSDEATPSDAELRVAQAQLVGWLEGLFHGIQTALVAQQMAAQAQLSQMRRGLPPGVAAGGFPGAGQPGGPGARPDERPGPGQYL
ncbi:bacterial proteasome activator family protein [Puerhibacterium puerhi]|uniref:bacterial proteasome activator family protein n=1 Tax=Puerhibacterium puerhi TaxID=2692623 RepID=UPI001359D89A|nr:bacterial proteasome activator family protein [Puerhibacterium puerhi]